VLWVLAMGVGGAAALTRARRAGQAMLERAGVRVMLNELSSTVVIERPTEEAFVRKWQLACQVRRVGLGSEGLHQGQRGCCGAAARRPLQGLSWGVNEGVRRRWRGRTSGAGLRARGMSEMHAQGAWISCRCETSMREAGTVR